MMNPTELKNYARYIHGEKIGMQIGSCRKNICQYNFKNVEAERCDYICYIHEESRCVIIWNQSHHRNLCIPTKTLSIEGWRIKLPESGDRFLECQYKHMKNRSGPYEKVLITDFETFSEIIPDLDEYFKFDTDDECIPGALSSVKDTQYTWCDGTNRARKSVEMWKRNQKFRKAVLESYGNQCAICHCDEVCLLEAAHITPISEEGSDSPENGICLCANHHIMFDKGLITIDIKESELNYAASSVKKMPWYQLLYKDDPHRKITQRNEFSNNTGKS